MKTIAVVVNPIAGGGRGKKVWRILEPGLNALFDRTDYRMSNKVNDLAEVTRSLLESSPDYLLIIGGDGTLNHVLNGFINQDGSVPKTQLAFFNAGCGGDFARLFPPQHVTEFLDRLAHRQSIQSNLGKITLADQSIRYFINIASCGLSGLVVSDSAQSRWMKKLGGTINYLTHSLMGILKYQTSPVSIQIDDHTPFECTLLMMAVCNGQYFGGRMHVAPMAKIDDGLFDITLFRDFTKLDALIKFYKIYSASHLLDKNVHYIQARSVVIEPLTPREILIEADGEPVGKLPARFEIVPEMVSLII